MVGGPSNGSPLLPQGPLFPMPLGGLFPQVCGAGGPASLLFLLWLGGAALAAPVRQPLGRFRGRLVGYYRRGEKGLYAL